MRPVIRNAMIFIFSIISFQAFAQEQFYNSLLQKEDIFSYFKTEFVELDELDVRHHIYYRNNSRVVEFYDRDSKEFLGVLVDIKKNSISALDFVRDNNKLKSLLQDNPPDLAMALFTSKPISGMSISQVEDLLGKPDKMKYSIKNNQQVLKYLYESGTVHYFFNGKLIKDLDE